MEREDQTLENQEEINKKSHEESARERIDANIENEIEPTSVSDKNAKSDDEEVSISELSTQISEEVAEENLIFRDLVVGLISKIINGDLDTFHFTKDKVIEVFNFYDWKILKKHLQENIKESKIKTIIDSFKEKLFKLCFEDEDFRYKLKRWMKITLCREFKLYTYSLLDLNMPIVDDNLKIFANLKCVNEIFVKYYNDYVEPNKAIITLDKNCRHIFKKNNILNFTDTENKNCQALGMRGKLDEKLEEFVDSDNFYHKYIKYINAKFSKLPLVIIKMFADYLHINLDFPIHNLSKLTQCNHINYGAFVVKRSCLTILTLLDLGIIQKESYVDENKYINEISESYVFDPVNLEFLNELFPILLNLEVKEVISNKIENNEYRIYSAEIGNNDTLKFLINTKIIYPERYVYKGNFYYTIKKLINSDELNYRLNLGSIKSKEEIIELFLAHYKKKPLITADDINDFYSLERLTKIASIQNIKIKNTQPSELIVSTKIKLPKKKLAVDITTVFLGAAATIASTIIAGRVNFALSALGWVIFVANQIGLYVDNQAARKGNKHKQEVISNTMTVGENTNNQLQQKLNEIIEKDLTKLKQDHSKHFTASIKTQLESKLDKPIEMRREYGLIVSKNDQGRYVISLPYKKNKDGQSNTTDSKIILNEDLSLFPLQVPLHDNQANAVSSSKKCKIFNQKVVSRFLKLSTLLNIVLFSIATILAIVSRSLKDEDCSKSNCFTSLDPAQQALASIAIALAAIAAFLVTGEDFVIKRNLSNPPPERNSLKETSRLLSRYSFFASKEHAERQAIINAWEAEQLKDSQLESGEKISETSNLAAQPLKDTREDTIVSIEEESKVSTNRLRHKFI